MRICRETRHMEKVQNMTEADQTKKFEICVFLLQSMDDANPLT